MRNPLASMKGFTALLTALDLAELVDSALEALDASQQVQVELPRRAMVRADRLLTQRTLINLLVNAAKHGTPAIVVTGELDGEAVRVVVRGHGPGVSEEFRPRLFERFARQDSRNRNDQRSCPCVHEV